MSSKPLLYSYFRSSASWRVRIALAHKGIDYEYRAVNLIKDGGQQRTEDYENINPMKQVPSLEIDGTILTQSIPIIEYLEETKSGPSLLPKDPLLRAKARGIAEIVNSGIQPLQNLSVLQRIAQLTGKDEDKAAWAKEWLTKGFVAIEKVLVETAGKYCVGDEVSIADACLVPQVYNGNRFAVDFSQFPTITRVNSELIQLDAFKAADPTKQPDCPEDLRG